VGIDVGTKIIPILMDQFGDRFEAPSAFDKVLNDGRKGKKNGKGFYSYEGKKPGKEVDESIYDLLSLTPAKRESAETVAERCVLMMLNEAARCLDEGVIRSARDGDIGAIFGIGFPPFRGGPFRYMDKLGIQNVVDKLSHYASTIDKKFEPAECLKNMASEGKRFY
jgi:3-hydroxyacyl-CoA dehydrogenase/enoyl-CoA hydratase/3-hydroxybutyryl-CoA epimerase